MAEGLDDEDRKRVRNAEDEARTYITSFSWCPAVTSISYVDGVPGIVCVFRAIFENTIEGSLENRLWIVVGDLPSAYLVAEAGDNAREVLSVYCELMEDWVSAVRSKHSLADVFPVRVEANEELAEMLHGRISFLRQEIIDTLV